MVRSPLTGEMLRPSVSGRGSVQLDRLLSDDDFGLLAEWFRQYPEMSLRAYGSYDGSIRNLEFLRFFPFLRRFEFDSLYNPLSSLDGLRHLPADAEELGLVSRVGAPVARVGDEIRGLVNAAGLPGTQGDSRVPRRRALLLRRDGGPATRSRSPPRGRPRSRRSWR